uniref:Zona pellucida sperm-binding protein 3 n=1 Tax=Sphaeramia orbicularis TaxID=375764 RepID=A0A672Y2F3_9TELE
MGFRDVLLLGFILLLSGDNLCAVTQNWLNPNEALNQIPQEEKEVASELPRSVQTNRSEQSDHPSVDYKLKSSLRKQTLLQRPEAKEQMQTFQNPQRSETAGELTPEQLQPKAAVQNIPVLEPPVKQESKVLVKFEQWVPVAADSVAVQCGEGGVTVKVKQNFLGNGQLIRPSDLTLGGCAAQDAADHILHFQADLQECGSTKTITEDTLIYTFSLIYTPTPIGSTFILKTNPAKVEIECHYPRRHYVSSKSMRPTWKPFAAYKQAENQLHFSLRLMTEDWQSQRPSSVYFLSDEMHMEASVLQGHHVPLRVYVDSCVATADPDPSSHPRYVFISNHGCLTDAKLTGAKSYFMPRKREDKLHFQLKAFRFQQDHRNLLYITCKMRATTVSVPFDSQNKACSFLTEANRWVASGGDNKVCSCCETSCSAQRWRRSLEAAEADAGTNSSLTAATSQLGYCEFHPEFSVLTHPEFLVESCTLYSEIAPQEKITNGQIW